MDNLIAIEVNGLYKDFKVFTDRSFNLKEALLFSNRRKYEKRKVLDGISFVVKKGEAVGLIGENGCGKSTILKMLTRIMFPDKGNIQINGRVSSLIELGAGFHPHMTGRENIYINASIFGLTKKEIDKRVSEIVAFSELVEFIDNPVRTYSSGMYMRLAFSVAINVDADILLIDEILAVGDVRFQKKCFNKLQQIKREGVTIVIVSHSLGQIEQICDRTIWINNGVIRAEGLPRDVHSEYLSYMAHQEYSKESIEEQMNDSVAVEYKEEYMSSNEAIILNRKRWGNGKARILDVSVMDENEIKKSRFITGEKMIIRVEYTADYDLDNPVIGVGFWTSSGQRFYGTNSVMDGVIGVEIKKGERKIFEYTINEIPFMNGEYQLEIAIEDNSSLEQLDYWLDALKFTVDDPYNEIGIARINHTWSIREGNK